MAHPRNIALGLVALDVGASVLVFNLVNHFRGLASSGDVEVLRLAAPTIALGVAIHLIQGYRMRTDMLSVDYASQHIIALVGATLATLLLSFAVVPAGYELAPQSSRIVIGLSFLILIPLTLAYRRIIYLRVIASHGVRYVVFLGDAASFELFRTECRTMNMSQGVIYSIPNAESAPPWADAQNERRVFSEVLEDIQSGTLAVEAIVLRETARELPPEISRQLVQLYFSGVPTYTLELFHEVYWQKIPLYRLNQTWIFQAGFQIAREPVFERIKRFSDILFSLTGIGLAAPLLVAAAIAIWLEDRGAVFFVQTRIGKNHQPFPLFKLRTMRPSDKPGDPYTRPGDTRITTVGKFLRATRIDEFPQLWNVLRGDMSLIGPRAEWDRLVEDYEREISCYHFRHLVKPGITGWAQVNYPYGASMEDTIRKLEYDLYYIRHFSFRLDATIVLKTIHVMLFGKGR